MRLTTFILALGATLATAAPKDPSTQTSFKPPQPDPYEQLHQAQYGLAKALDRKDWEEVKKYMTNDIVYDNSQFQTQGRPGGRASRAPPGRGVAAYARGEWRSAACPAPCRQQGC